MIHVYQYAKCNTCKKALKWLDTHGIAYEALPIVEQTPSQEVLKSAIERSGLPIRRFFNTSGQSYRDGGFKDTVGDMSVDEAAAALAADGMLIKRPLVISDDVLLVGFKEDVWKMTFKVD